MTFYFVLNLQQNFFQMSAK